MGSASPAFLIFNTKIHTVLNACADYAMINVQTGSCVGGLLSTSYRREEDDRMSDYEIIMIFLTILTLLFLAMSFVSNRKS